MKRPLITIVGVGAEGCAGLSSRAVGAACGAGVLVGGQRQLDFFPQFQGARIALAGGLESTLERVEEAAQESSVCVLASGDPLYFGIAGRLIERFGSERIEVLPNVSSMQWAFAKAGLRWDDAALLTVHGRPLAGLVAKLRRQRKAAIFTDGENSPARIAAHMIEFNAGEFRAVVCERLGTPDERIRRFKSLSELSLCTDADPLNVLVLERRGAWSEPSTLSFIEEEAFAKRMPKKGLITKREVRILSLAALELSPTATLWDVGAASASVSIEASRLCPEGRIFAVEVDGECIEYARENLRNHGADNVELIHGRAPAALADLPDPDAVFIGGSQGSLDELIGLALERLKPGGRLVANAVTLDNVSEAYTAFKSRNIQPELTLLQAGRGQKLAHYMRYEALNPIHIFAATRPSNEESGTKR